MSEHYQNIICPQNICKEEGVITSFWESSLIDYPWSKEKKKVKTPFEDYMILGKVSWATDDVIYYLVFQMLAFSLCSFYFARDWF